MGGAGMTGSTARGRGGVGTGAGTRCRSRARGRALGAGNEACRSGCAGLDSGNSTKRASIGAGGAGSILGGARKNPKPHRINTQSATASGIDHQHGASLARIPAMPTASIVFDRDQKMNRTGRTGLQHGLHDQPLRGSVVRRHHQTLLAIL